LRAAPQGAQRFRLVEHGTAARTRGTGRRPRGPPTPCVPALRAAPRGGGAVTMRLSGVDPSIIRELSGIYKPFVKAFKELISNAFDSDANSVIVSFSPDFSSVSVSDDGTGMTPFDFRNDF